MFTQRSILYSIQKHISVLRIPPRAERPTCLSERFAKKAELFGWLTISLSLSKCIFSVNPSFQRQDMKSLWNVKECQCQAEENPHLMNLCTRGHLSYVLKLSTHIDCLMLMLWLTTDSFRGNRMRECHGTSVECWVNPCQIIRGSCSLKSFLESPESQ